MQTLIRLYFPAALIMLVLCGCNAEDSGDTVGVSQSSGVTNTSDAGTGAAASPGPVFTVPVSQPSGTQNRVIATASVSGTVSAVVGAARTVSVTFTSSDGNPISGLAISGTTLPADWSGIQGYSCTQVGAGSSCVVNLSFAPLAVESGSVLLNYIFIDNSKGPQTPGGTLTIPYEATASNNVVASVAPVGQVLAVPGAGSQTVNVNFTTDDGHAATDLGLSSALSALPSGWSSQSQTFGCAIVSTGNGCQLSLDYNPTTAGSGTLTLSYQYTDDSGAAKTGAINIPYSTATSGNVVATVSPTGQVNAIEKSGSQGVTVTFDTDDAKTATGLKLLSSQALPAGWTSKSGSLACAAVSVGNGCQLELNYAPTADGRGTISLYYSYINASGIYSVGSADIDYAATTDDNVVGSTAPTGQIHAVVGEGAQTVTVTFVTDDGRPATALQVTADLTALPAGWSSTDPSFECSGLDGGEGCQLTLTYDPAAIASGSVALPYSYRNNSGQLKSGTVNIPFRATTDNSIVATSSPAPVAATSGTSMPVTVTFTSDDGNPMSDLSITSGLTSLPSGWTAPGSFNCASLGTGATCQLALQYLPTLAQSGSVTLGFDYTNNSGMVKSATVIIAYTATDPPPTH
jgi:hypothetical protein